MTSSITEASKPPAINTHVKEYIFPVNGFLRCVEDKTGKIEAETPNGTMYKCKSVTLRTIGDGVLVTKAVEYR